jgi:hypothetical protein
VEFFYCIFFAFRSIFKANCSATRQTWTAFALCSNQRNDLASIIQPQPGPNLPHISHQPSAISHQPSATGSKGSKRLYSEVNIAKGSFMCVLRHQAW